jgi:hypothetical protein
MSDHQGEEIESLDDVLGYVKERLARGEGAHLDQDLMALGDRLTAQPLPATLSSSDRLARDAWHQAGPEARHQLAHLAIRMVGNEHWPKEPPDRLP